jgi:hypothetical protein
MIWVLARIFRRKRTAAPVPPGFTISSPVPPVSNAGDLTTNPLDYLSRNLIIAKPSSRLDNVKNVNRPPVDVVLISQNAKTGSCTYDGAPMELIVVVPLADFNRERDYKGLQRCDPFKAYICPFQNNQALGVMVSGGADFVFTDPMNGCSFGVGSRTNDGARLVYHANSLTLHNKPENEGLSQAEKQAKMINKKLGKLDSAAELMFQPEDYRGGIGELSSSMVGIRDPAKNVWSFYAQIYRTVSMSPLRYELVEIRTLLYTVGAESAGSC